MRCIAIAHVSDDQLRDAATKLWTELYGEPPTRVVDAPPRNVVAAK